MTTNPIVFSSGVTKYRIPRILTHPVEGAFQVVIDPSRAGKRSLSVLNVLGGPNLLTVTPERAEEPSLSSTDSLRADRLAVRMQDAGITLNGPDHLFYLPVAEQDAVRHEPVVDGTGRDG
jgi:hypothetical protein